MIRREKEGNLLERKIEGKGNARNWCHPLQNGLKRGRIDGPRKGEKRLFIPKRKRWHTTREKNQNQEQDAWVHGLTGGGKGGNKIKARDHASRNRVSSPPERKRQHDKESVQKWEKEFAKTSRFPNKRHGKISKGCKGPKREEKDACHSLTGRTRERRKDAAMPEEDKDERKCFGETKGSVIKRNTTIR